MPKPKIVKTPDAPTEIVHPLTASQAELVRAIAEYQRNEQARISAVAAQRFAAILSDLKLPADTQGRAEERDGQIVFVQVA